MPAAEQRDDRRVRHLRLRAPTEDQARATQGRLQDALRCASIGTAGEAVRVVRRLDLGRFGADASAQAIALLIEQRVAAAGLQWVAGGEPAAAGANAVVFANGLQVREQLALRLLGSRRAPEWYWPLAAREYDADDTPVANLRRMGAWVAQRPEAPAAWPHWVGTLFRGVGAAVLCDALDEPTATVLTDLALGAVPAAARRAPSLAGQFAAAGPAAAAPWLQRSLRALERGAPGAPAPSRSTGTKLPVRSGTRADFPPAVSDLPLAAAAAARGGAPALSQRASLARPREAAASAPWSARRSVVERQPATDSRAGPDPTPPDPAAAPQHRAPARPWQPRDAARPTHQARPADCPDDSLEDDPSALGSFTAHAGVFWLLPLLQRLGLPQWLRDHPSLSSGPACGASFAAAVLARALGRLDAAPEDAAWGLVSGAGAGPQRAVRARAPAPWTLGTTATLLRSPTLHGTAPAQCIEAARRHDELVAAWLLALRRALRRGVGISLATLVRRHGLLTATATHIDVHLRLAEVDLRVRRAALDIDPGWLPWFGRVLRFHYHPRWPGQGATVDASPWPSAGRP